LSFLAIIIIMLIIIPWSWFPFRLGIQVSNLKIQRKQGS